jgi:hypothetical protein
MDEERAEAGKAAAPPGGAGERLGESLGRLVKRARAASRAAQPEAEQLARQARAAAESALPHIQRASAGAAARTGRFVREHEDEIRQLAGTAGRLMVSRAGPPALRPVMFGALDGLMRRPGEASKERKPEAEPPEAKGEQEGPYIF